VIVAAILPFRALQASAGLERPLEVIRQAAADPDAIGARWAIIGGLAVVFRAEPRFAKDVAIADDREAQLFANSGIEDEIVRRLRWVSVGSGGRRHCPYLDEQPEHVGLGEPLDDPVAAEVQDRDPG